MPQDNNPTLRPEYSNFKKDICTHLFTPIHLKIFTFLIPGYSRCPIPKGQKKFNVSIYIGNEWSPFGSQYQKLDWWLIVTFITKNCYTSPEDTHFEIPGNWLAPNAILPLRTYSWISPQMIKKAPPNAPTYPELWKAMKDSSLRFSVILFHPTPLTATRKEGAGRRGEVDGQRGSSK